MRFLVIALALGGCVYADYWTEPEPESEPEPETEPPPPTDARRAFDTHVFPIINAKCSGRACHSTGSLTTLDFIDVDAATAYERITVSPVVGDFSRTAPLLGFVKPGTHKGISYTAAEEARILEWLDLERAARQ